MTPGLGVGMDLPWSGPYGIHDGQLAPRTVAFLEREGHRFGSAFVSWQPRDRGVPRVEHVEAAFSAFFARVPHAVRCLHQTALNLAGAGYDRSAIVDFTNALIDRFELAWVNEDLGNWSVGGWSLPYPEAPPLTDEAVRHAAAVCREVDEALRAPLVVEFPGFERIPDGDLDAYDAFRRVIERSGCACNLDTGHLLTWRWLQGHRGEALLDGLDRLPLDHTIELHCAGVVQTGERLVDAHHGVLHELQHQLVDRLLERCPNLRTVTYEDPRYDANGVLPAPARASLDALEQQVGRWNPAPARPLPPATAQDVPLHQVPWEADLRSRYRAPEGEGYRKPLASRSTRGLRPLAELYGFEGDAVLRDFLDSDEGASWSDLAWAVPGRAIEDAMGRFLAPGSDAHLTACVKLLALHPDPPFVVPEGFSRQGEGWMATGGTPEAPKLYAAARGQVLIGRVNAQILAILAGERPAGAEAVVQKLGDLGLLADRPASRG